MILTGKTEEEKDRVGQFVCNNLGVKWVKERYSVLGWEIEGKIVSGAIYEQLTAQNVFVHLYVEDNHPGMKEYLWYGFDYPFNQLKVKRITAAIDSTNEKCISLVKKLGFIEECTLESAGRVGDLIMFKMFKENCKWIKHET